MNLTEIQKKAIARVFNSYHADPEGRGKSGQKYVSPRGNEVVLPLPNELMEFCEPNGGINNGRPAGIRRYNKDAHMEVTMAFYSIETLTDYITSGVKGYPKGTNPLYMKHEPKPIMTDDRKYGVTTKYSPLYIQALVKRFGFDKIGGAMHTMTMAEFERTYNII